MRNSIRDKENRTTSSMKNIAEDKAEKMHWQLENPAEIFEV